MQLDDAKLAYLEKVDLEEAILKAVDLKILISQNLTLDEAANYFYYIYNIFYIFFVIFLTRKF